MIKKNHQCALRIDALSHSYEGISVLNEFSLCLQSGDLVSIMGPSGSGKSTLLRLIAGFERVQAGRIFINDQLVASSEYHLSANLRRVGFVFQDFALFPHLNVNDNIAFGLQNLSTNEKTQRVDELLALTGLTDKVSSLPHELSGGQKQRVALARALAPRPSLICLDETFSGLDPELRSQLAFDLKRILKELKMTALFVTHSQREAFEISDAAGVLRHGKLLQWGSTFDLYHEPRSKFVAQFIGQCAFLRANILNANTFGTELGQLKSQKARNFIVGSHVEILLRPEDVVHDDDSQLKARIVEKSFRGAYHLYTLKLNSGQLVYSHVLSHHNHAIGELLGIRLDCEHVVVMS